MLLIFACWYLISSLVKFTRCDFVATNFARPAQDLNITLFNEGERKFYNISVMFRPEIPIPLIRKYYDSVGPVAMLSILERSHNYCHDEGHNVGKVVYERTGSLAAAMLLCGSRCTHGCFHGAIMQLMINIIETSTVGSMQIAKSGKKSIRAYYQKICNNVTAGLKDDSGDCFHALGHAILAVVVNNNISACMEECKAVKERYDQYACLCSWCIHGVD